MEPATIAWYLGLIIGFLIFTTTKYWLEIPKLNDILGFFIAVMTVYGISSLFEDLVNWWLK